MADTDFAASVYKWTEKAKENVLQVFRLSFKLTVQDILVNTPYRSGYLRASLTVTLNFPAAINSANNGVEGGVVPAVQNYDDTITAAQMGDKLYAAFTAAYAPRIEYGFMGTDSLGRSYMQAGRGMVRLAAQRYAANVQTAINIVSK